MKAFNLTELVNVLLDYSDFYTKRCIDVGNNRNLILFKNQKSKYYINKYMNINFNDIQKIYDDSYLVPSEKEPEKSYMINSLLGLCEYPVGRTEAPCKHKHAVAIKYKTFSFDHIPEQNPEMRAFYHFLGCGQT